MPDTSSNEFWKNTKNYQSFELRSHRFRSEMLSVFYTWLGIKSDSSILDGGCGSGVFTRYLAAGLSSGHITGFDINKTFIEYGKSKAKELALENKMTLEVADGFNLHYDDETFDAVTNYTYIGTLSDPEAGMKELIRVCKTGGTVSCVIATNAIPYVSWQGDYPFDADSDLQKLSCLENKIFTDIHKSNLSKQSTELMLFKQLGLVGLHMYPFSHLICYSDEAFPLEYRKKLALDETQDEINWLKFRYSENESVYGINGFSPNDFIKLLSLLEQKYKYLNENFETCDSYEWHGGYNYIVTGIKI